MPTIIITLTLTLLSINTYAYDYQKDLARIREDIYEFNLNNQKEELLFGIALTSLSFFFEKGSQDFFDKNKNHLNKTISDTGNLIGNPFIDFAIPVTIYALSPKDTKISKSSFSAAESVFFSTLIAGTSSIAIGRSRPYKNEGRHTYKPFSLNSFDSFPSKHLAASSAFFTTYAKYYDAPILYIFPLITAFGRMYENQHYLADTVIGAAIGYIIADYVYSKDIDRENKRSLIPIIIPTDKGALIGFTYNF